MTYHVRKRSASVKENNVSKQYKVKQLQFILKIMMNRHAEQINCEGARIYFLSEGRSNNWDLW
jgi:hypothetical protein